MRLGADALSAIEAAHVEWKITAAVRPAQFQARKAIEDAAEHEMSQRDRRVGGIANQIGEVEGPARRGCIRPGA